MPAGQRSRLKGQALITRAMGQTVKLHIRTASSTVGINPLDAVALQSPPSPDNDLVVPVYAIVRFHKTDDFTYDLGGRINNRKATVELTSMYQTNGTDQIDKLYAIELNDGSLLGVKSKNLSDGGQSYALECEGWTGIRQ